MIPTTHVATKSTVARRALPSIVKRFYFHEYKYSPFWWDRSLGVKESRIDEKSGDGYNSCPLDRWCDGKFISHYNKEPLWWSRTVIREKRISECELWENGGKEEFLSLGFSKSLEEEITSMFQTVKDEKQRPRDLENRIKLAFQGELEADDSAPPPPPLHEPDFHALSTKLRYFARASGTYCAALLFESGSPELRKKMQYIHKEYPVVTATDLDVIGFIAAVEVAKGGRVNFCFGRQSREEFKPIIPDISKSSQEIRALFPPDTYTDEQIVALCGLNNVHENGVLDNEYFSRALASKNGLSGESSFKDICEKFAGSHDFFLMNLSDAVTIMTEAGVENWCDTYSEVNGQVYNGGTKWTKGRILKQQEKLN